MKPEELQIGDVIFFMDANGIPTHVAIYAGFRAETHFITHAVTDPYYSIITTRLRADEFPYRVFRPKDVALAAQTAHRMRIWAEHQVPFSLEKHELHINICDAVGFSHPKTGGATQRDYAMSLFSKNYYRYIEYAAHPSMPYFPHDKKTQGMYCSEAITAAFNAQKLIMLNAVKSSHELHGWVSDHTQEDIFTKQLERQQQPVLTQRYAEYLRSSRSERAYYPHGELPSNRRLDETPFLPSIAAWRSTTCSIEEFVDEFLSQNKFELPLDSIAATPWAMMSYFQAHEEHWQPLGEMKVVEKKYPLAKLEADKAAWRVYIHSLFQEAQEKQSIIRRTCGSQIDLLKDELESPAPLRKVKRSRSMEDVSAVLSQEQEKIELLTEASKYRTIRVLTTPEKPTTKTEARKGSPVLISRSGLKPKALFQSDADEGAPLASGAVNADARLSKEFSSLTLKK